jgi:hypothetical protein
VPYHVDLPDTEQAYLDALPLSPLAQDRIKQFIAGFIANVPDAFRNDPTYRFTQCDSSFSGRDV